MPLAVNRGEVPGKVRMHVPAHPDPAPTVGATRRPAVSEPRISSSHASPQTCPNPNEVTSRGRGEPRRAGGAGTAFPEAELGQKTSPRSEANSRGLLPRAAAWGAAQRGARGLRRAGRSPWRVGRLGLRHRSAPSAPAARSRCRRRALALPAAPPPAFYLPRRPPSRPRCLLFLRPCRSVFLLLSGLISAGDSSYPPALGLSHGSSATLFLVKEVIVSPVCFLIHLPNSRLPWLRFLSQVF